MSNENQVETKVADMHKKKASAASLYRSLMFGSMPRASAIKAEIIFSCLSGMPGAAGLFLRSKLYRPLFASAGSGLVIGRYVTLRHPHKIAIGEGTIIDDNVMLDAKGSSNRGISIGKNVFIGRNTIVYCKNGDIELADRVNISSNCTLFSSNSLSVGAGTIMGGYCYLLSGGEYDYKSTVPFADQSGKKTSGPLSIGSNTWLGTRVTVLDSAGSIGEHCVIGAGAVVNRAVPADSLAVGIPAEVKRRIAPGVEGGPGQTTAHKEGQQP
jgi:acetyltransferase-like isoleucine patch superfamily enzyme